MRWTSGLLASSATLAWPSRRFRERDLEVKMWRAKACRRLILPVPVFLNRLAAPLWVFSFGINLFRKSPQGAASGNLYQDITGRAVSAHADSHFVAKCTASKLPFPSSTSAEEKHIIVYRQ